MKRETHAAKVLDGSDPSKLGGAKVQVNDLVDERPLDEENFVPGRYPFAGNGEGFYYAPQAGTLLEVEVEGDSEAAVEELAPRWVGMLYSSKDEIPTEFQSDPTNRGGVKFGDEVFLQDKTQALTALISAMVRLGEETASHPLVRGDTWNTAWETWVSALETYLSAESTLASANATNFTSIAAACTVSPLTALKSFFEALALAWTNHGSAVSTFASATTTWKGQKETWLSTKCRTE